MLPLRNAHHFRVVDELHETKIGPRQPSAVLREEHQFAGRTWKGADADRRHRLDRTPPDHTRTLPRAPLCAPASSLTRHRRHIVRLVAWLPFDVAANARRLNRQQRTSIEQRVACRAEIVSGDRDGVARAAVIELTAIHQRPCRIEQKEIRRRPRETIWRSLGFRRRDTETCSPRRVLPDAYRRDRLQGIRRRRSN